MTNSCASIKNLSKISQRPQWLSPLRMPIECWPSANWRVNWAIDGVSVKCINQGIGTWMSMSQVPMIQTLRWPISANTTNNSWNTQQCFGNTTQCFWNTTQYFWNTTQNYRNTRQNYRKTTQNIKNTKIIVFADMGHRSLIL